MLFQWTDNSTNTNTGTRCLWVSVLILGCFSQVETIAQDNPGEMESKMRQSIEVPNAPARYYGMMVRTAKGVGGRVFINDVDVENFGVEGAKISSNLPQCYLHVGKNSLRIALEYLEINSANTDQEGLIKLDLHAMYVPDFPSENNLFFRINWSPDKTGNKTWEFVLAENQTPVRTAICD